jgi:hypothetical protein
MREFYFEDVPANERPQMLEDNCEKVVEKTYIDHWPQTKALTKKNEYIDIQAKIAKLTAEKAQMDAEFKGQIEPLAEQAGILLHNIQQGGELVTGDAYMFVDEEEKAVGFYDKNGHLIESRPATPEELSPTIFRHVSKTGTHD